jgi:hypothetical protein
MCVYFVISVDTRLGLIAIIDFGSVLGCDLSGGLYCSALLNIKGDFTTYSELLSYSHVLFSLS